MNKLLFAMVAALCCAVPVLSAQADEATRKNALDACRIEYDAQRAACKQSSGAASGALKACRDNAKRVYRDCTDHAKEAAKAAP